ncbi:MAG: hypothetical protein QOI66_4443 [Myxococcales bacterium]|jgi:hypothetical protein|nr:hypothetical protein [Myxococcales bacterium]
MLGVAVLVALLAADGPFDVDGTIIVEARGGEAPIASGFAPETMVVGIITPDLGAQYSRPGARLRVDYSLRIFARETGTGPTTAPLLLHTVILGGDLRASRLTDLRARATVLEGAADYGYLPQVFGANQATLVVVPKIFSVTGDVGGRQRISRTTTLELDVTGTHHRSIGDSAFLVTGPNGEVVPSVLPRFTSITVTPDVALRLSARDTLTLSTAAEYNYISPLSSLPLAGAQSSTFALTSLTVVPAVALQTQVARHSKVDLKAGVAVTRVTKSNAADTTILSPVGLAGIDHRVMGTAETALHATGKAEVGYYLDPILGTAASRGTAAAALTAVFPPSWTVAVQGVFSSTLTAHPLPSDMGPVYFDEVTATVEIPVRHRLSDSVIMEFGGRWSDRSPYYTAPNFGFHQRQLWAYVMLIGTTRDVHRTTTP